MAESSWQCITEVVDLDEEQLEKLKSYLKLLQRWNKVYNLTAIRDPEQMLVHHIFDSLVVAPHIQGKFILDVGSGAGLPGIPLAIVFPEYCFSLLDTNGKKTRFIRQAVIELGLTNVDVVHSRVEAWVTELKFDTIISRAFASVSLFSELSFTHLSDKGYLCAMKGHFPREEVSKLPIGFVVDEICHLQVPQLEAERCLLKLRKEGC